jgi:hypothetical protein
MAAERAVAVGTQLTRSLLRAPLNGSNVGRTHDIHFATSLHAPVARSRQLSGIRGDA